MNKLTNDQDTNPIFWKTKLEKGEFSNVTSELV